jgi:signal transduction histidine kinase
MYIEDFQEKHPQLEIQTELAEVRTQVPEEMNLALFRICQEALNNIVRHANATKAWLRLRIQNGELCLEIQDNGKGMPANTNMVDQTRNGHYGLAGMKERAEALGGGFTVISTPGQGTIIRVSTPIHKKGNC